MCSKDNLVPANLASSLGMFLLALSMLLMGILLRENPRVDEAYGSTVKLLAQGFVGLGAALILSCLCGIYGAKKHNKFCLLMFMIFSLACLALEFFVGQSITSNTTVLFSRNFQIECFRALPASDTWPTKEECQNFLNDNARTSLYSMWLSMFNSATRDSSAKQLMVDIQNEGFCCGFGPPAKCTATESRKCSSAEPGWYPASYFCNVDGKGCPYELPVGECWLNPIKSHTMGCGLIAQNWVRNQIAPMGDAAKVLVAIPAMSFIAACCLFFKRKDDDVLPMKYVRQPAAPVIFVKGVAVGPNVKKENAEEFAEQNAMTVKMRIANAREERAKREEEEARRMEMHEALRDQHEQSNIRHNQ